ncbi:MAG: OmpA/MotB domain protein [Bacteroidetes bacterium]|nr:OmpA/MotB domain protein [Bacteroidota bacterium]
MKKQFIIALSCLTAGLMQAQQAGHYLYLGAGAGSQSLNYQIVDGTQKGGAGYTLNAAYSYFFDAHWGIQSGIGIQLFGSQSTLDMLTTESAVDTDNQTYELRTDYNALIEQQRVMFLDIPLLGQYLHHFNAKWGMMASLGAKVSLPVYRSFKTVGGDITTTGYYSQWNLLLYDLPQHGFYTTDDTYKGKPDIKPAVMTVTELGALYKASYNTEIYFGAYFNYGLNNVIDADSKHIFLQDGTYNGILASTQTTEVRPVAFGLKAGVYWNLGKKSALAGRKTGTAVDLSSGAAVASQAQVADVAPVVEVAVPTPQPVDTIKVVEVAVAEPVKAEPVSVDTVVVDPLEKAKEVSVLIMRDIVKNTVETDQAEWLKTKERIDAGIKELSQILIANPDLRLTLSGHTDNSDTPANSIKKGLSRSISMRTAFLKNGVPAHQVIPKAKGLYAWMEFKLVRVQ